MDYQYNCLEEPLTHGIDFLLLKSLWDSSFKHNLDLSKLAHGTVSPKANKTNENFSTE